MVTYNVVLTSQKNNYKSKKKTRSKGSVREKWKEEYAYGEKKSLLISTNLTSICCVYKEKIVRNDLY